MKVTLVMGISVNGYITGKDDDTGWLKDFDTFHKTVAEFGIAVMGKRTYEECVKYDAFPYKGAFNIVMTHDGNLLSKHIDNSLFTDNTPEEVLNIAGQKGFKRLLVIGGGHVNSSFLKAGLIDEIIVDIHPVVISEGLRLFEGEFPSLNLELSEYKEINDRILQVRYAVRK